MTQINNSPKKFGIKLACEMAADCIRENYAPLSVIISNLIALQKADTFPKALSKEFFKRPTPVAPNDVKVVRSIMDAMRSPHNGVSNLLVDNMSSGWVFKKAPPADQAPSKTFNNNNRTHKSASFSKNKTTTAPTATVVIKKSSNFVNPKQ